jgi:MoaA/NifB/PqqE/SkfB family radical SAM enzyme
MMYQIEITTHCTSGCFYCAGRDMPQQHMAWDLFASIIDSIPPGRHLVSLQGEGEPTLHPQFWAMAAAVRARGLAPFTITNGATIDAERIAATFPRIGLSIDTLDATEARRIGRDEPARVLANVEALSRRMSARRIHIMSVNYGQPLAEVREFARARGYSHSVQALHGKPDYARRYPGLLETPAARYTHRCRFLERPLKRYFDVAGREYPCCFIKDARLHEPIAAMQAKMAAGEIPAACTGCREVLAADSLPQPRQPAAGVVPAVASAAPVFSIITTCKGRLEHLKKSLPRMALQANAEVIVVDYDCPDGTAAWVAGHFPGVQVLRVGDAPVFNIARARNLGAAAARGRWLCFIDADILLDAGFVELAQPLLQDGAFHTIAHPQPAAVGSVVCDRDDFAAIGGYDEIMQGYGTEDRDLYLRMAARGCRREQLPGTLLQPLAHERADSVRHYEIKDFRLNLRINSTYVQIKQDLRRQFGDGFLTADIRRTIYTEIDRAFRQAAQAGQAASRVDITLPAALDVRFYGWQMTRVWSYLLDPVAPAAVPLTGLVNDGLPAARPDVET